jgi:tRNA1(Val) A37 N6-methylase TrmN6
MLPLPHDIAWSSPASRHAADIWNVPASEDYALPTETWREVLERRQQYRLLRKRLEAGEVRSVADLITYNLDIQQLVLDNVRSCEQPDLLEALYESLLHLTVLDPTCGAGAFLFAALRVLEPLYAACLERMQTLLEQAEQSQSTTPTAAVCLTRLRTLLSHVAHAPGRRYFIYHTISRYNLYGVDIVPAAVEACQLRLLLLLCVGIERGMTCESWPEPDLHMYVGNALAGFTTLQEVQGLLKDNQPHVCSPTLKSRIEEQAARLNRDLPTTHLLETQAAPQTVGREVVGHRRVRRLRRLLHRALATATADERTQPGEQGLRALVHQFHQWQERVQPFHWWIEFPDVMRQGGFAVIMGNPPYVAYKQVRANYQLRGYQTLACGNLYAYVLERSLQLLKPGGRCGMIVPISAVASAHYRPLMRLLLERQLWISTYANRPGKLFAGVEQRLAILLLKDASPPALFVSPYRHWYEQERPHLFATLTYAPASLWPSTGQPLKSGSELAERIFARLLRHTRSFQHPQKRRAFALEGFVAAPQASADADIVALEPRNTIEQPAVWVHNGPTYWVRALPFAPNVGLPEQRSRHYQRLPVRSQDEAIILSAILSSSTFYFFYKLVSNCRDLSLKELSDFPLGHLQPAVSQRLLVLGKRLAQRLRETATRCIRQYPGGQVVYEEYYPAFAREILDEIDMVLAGHYGLTAEELDFVLNYELKYRLGRT